MSLTSFGDADLSDEWIEREQPPTIKFLQSSSLSGSVNILKDTSQNWTNVNEIISKDLLTKQTKPLTSLFEPPMLDRDDNALSMVQEEDINDGDRTSAQSQLQQAQDQEYRDAWASHSISASTDSAGPYQSSSESGTIRPGNTVRSADGLIPNFSFPRNGGSMDRGPEVDDLSRKENISLRKVSHRSKSDQSDRLAALSPIDEQAGPQPQPQTTPKKNTHKSSASSVSPTKSPLKLFHTEQDTFTRDHAARMIGMLSAAPVPAMEPLKPQAQPETQQCHESGTTVVAEVAETEPHRKRVKTHEPKGSFTLQNFNENADRLAAKLRAKSGGLGKGLPRVLEDKRPHAGRRISSAAERLEQERKKERNAKCRNIPQTSGFEAMDILGNQYAKVSRLGSKSTRSHFSDWESEANPESRQVSAAALATQGDNNKETASNDNGKSLELHVRTDTVPKVWTETSGKSQDQDIRCAAPATDESKQQQQHNRAPSSVSNTESRQARHITNFPPEALETLRHGNMIFDKEKQCWKRIDTSLSTEDTFDRIDCMGQIASASRVMDDYPDVIEFSSSTSLKSERVDQSSKAMAEETESNLSGISATTLPRRLPSDVQHSNLIKVSQIFDHTQMDDLANVTANMSMSRSTEYLLSAVNKRCGAGPWETVRSLDLSGLGLESLYGLSTFFPALTRLNVSNNSLTSLLDVPQGVHKLEAANNKVTSYRAVLSRLSHLEYVDLSNNQLQDVDVFSSLSHLRHLNVNKNQLRNIGGLRELDNLRSICARDNLISSIDFRHLQKEAPQLEKIDLAGNKIASIFGLDTMIQLVSLDLSDNALREYATHAPMDRLESLDLSKNALCHFTVGASMPRLKVINVSKNKLSSINLAMFPRLRRLYLDDNLFSEVPMPSRLKCIESFSIRRQDNGKLSINLDQLQEVRELYLSGNEIPDFQLRTVFHSLKYLEIAGMQLSELQSNFAVMAPNLRALNLSYNNLKSINPIRNLYRLGRLMLIKNNISDIANVVEILSPLLRLKALDLRENPCTDRFYTKRHAGQDVDFYANLDGMLHTKDEMQAWAERDDKYCTTLSDARRTRRKSYQNLIWTVCRALTWHDGRMLDPKSLQQADAYVTHYNDRHRLEA